MWGRLAAACVAAGALAACSGPAVPTRVLGEKVVRTPATPTAGPTASATAAPTASPTPSSAAVAQALAAAPAALPSTTANRPAPAPATHQPAAAPSTPTTPTTAPATTTPPATSGPTATPSPQWSGQTTSCAAVSPPTGASTLPAGVTAVVHVDSTSAPAGQPIDGQITLTNGGSTPVELHENTGTGDGVAVYDSWGDELRTTHTTQTVLAHVYQLPAGGSVSIPFRVPTAACAAGSSSATPLAAGGYSAIPWFAWSVPDGQAGNFRGPAQDITVTG